MAKNLHSVTFYIPNEEIEKFQNTLRIVASSMFDDGNKRSVSNYIRYLIYEDLRKRGFEIPDNCISKRGKKNGSLDT